VTLAAVLDAVPLEDGDPAMANATMLFDATKMWAGYDAAAATEYMFDNFINETTGMAKMNPGLDVHGDHKLDPPLTKDPELGLTDYLVKRKIFNFFLFNGCVPFTKEHALMEKIATQNPWPRPITVYGYDDSYAIAGDLFEAETDCVSEHNMGQVASNGLNNMAYFSRKAPINTPGQLLQNPDPSKDQGKPFNRSKTYLAIVVGDGDNMNFLKGSRKDWIQDRARICEADPEHGCFPLMWSLSPHTLYMAPQWAQWFYNASYRTKADYFVLPPSGDLYSYPARMKGAVADSFVKNTERDCTVMNTSGSVDWEWFTTWGSAIKNFYPRYTKNGIVRGLFPVNVPYMFPVLEFLGQQFKVFGGNVVLFKPNEWRGPQQRSASDMAKLINGYKPGTVSSLYITSDGGANLQRLYNMTTLLEEHIEVVNQNTIVDMALAANAHGLGGISETDTTPLAL